jgi:hypothetical protein
LATRREKGEQIVLTHIRFSAFAALFFVSAAVAASASPADSRLLALVPTGAQFVAGIEDPNHPPAKGWLLLLTRRSNLDYQDWIALSGVDPHRRADEIIEVAASADVEVLGEHLVLLAGQFDRDLIFRAALGNGAYVSEYGGQRVLLVKPFAREKNAMTASRWLVILDDRTAIFGSPELVRQAIDRYRSKSGPDPLLVQCLQGLHNDVNSWNVLLMSAAMFVRNVESEQWHAPWMHLLDGADELAIGIHYGSTDRIDFAVHTLNIQNASRLVALLARQRILPVDLSTNMRPRLQSMSVKQGRLRGSVLVSATQLRLWLAPGLNPQLSALNSQPKP